ncbi:MAG TPA: AsmA-like C-terminal region-containing protein [Verrucomicrobiae bacterium]|nr:AsmA-like C-terminal region-containing protein [Verrucomicrobiae bacterium]
MAAALLAPVFFNLDRYRPQVISFFEANTGKKVEIERLSLTFLPQMALHIQGFGIKSPPLFPPSYILKVARADAVLDFWALAHRKVVIRSVVLEEPVINLVSDPDGPWNFENPESATSKNTFPLGIIDKVVIHRGQLILSNLLPSDAAGPVFMEAHDIDSEMHKVDLAAIANPASPSLNGQGDWKAGRLRFGAVETSNVSSKFRLESRAVFFTELKADAYGGKATGDFSVSLAKKPASFKADARVGGINMGHLLAGFHETRGLLTGKLDGDLKLAGDIAHTQSPFAGMHGVGHLKVTNGQVPSLMLNANLMKLAHFNDLGPAKEHPASFSSIATDLELRNLRIFSKTIDIDGYGVDVDGSGSVSVSGSDDLDYQGLAAITTKQGFLINTFARFEGASLKDGKLSFPFQIQGTIENPKFSKGTKKVMTPGASTK